MDENWWRHAVVYQIYPRSFADGDGDGVGDLAGIIAHLDHLAWLGVDALWTSPIFPSPMADFGYDVADYCDIDPLFGDLATFDALVEAAHARGIKVLLDWVPNHTSDQHPWFVESRSSRDDPKRNWYVWRDVGPNGELPNAWQAHFGAGPAWTLDERTGQAYLHTFLAEQPDLNWDDPEVRAAMLATLRFWMERGVDGFRMDVIHYLGKSLTGESPEPTRRQALDRDAPVHRYLREIRATLDAYPGRTSVGEVFVLDEPTMASFYGHGDELHLAFNFRFVFTPFDAARLRRRIETALALLAERDATPVWVMSNHDIPRHRQRYGGSEEIARAAAVLLLALPGTAFVYQGEELGLLDAEVPAERVVDPGGRDGCRAPIPWTAEPGHGWNEKAWLPFAPEADVRNVASQLAEPDSIAHLYRRLLQLRRVSGALASSELRWREAPEGVLAFERGPIGDAVVVVVNTTDEPVRVPLGGSPEVLVATHLALENEFGGTVPGGGALIARVPAAPGA